jgi:hypothetical protein
MAAGPRPILASGDQGAAMALPARLWQHIQFGQAAMTALRLDDKEMAGRFMGESPADGFSVLFREQEDAVIFGATMLQLAPVIDGEIRIAPAVGLESGLIVLEASDEGQDRRFIGGQMCVADTNGRAP